MAFLGMMGACSSESDIDSVKKRVNEIDNKLEKISAQCGKTLDVRVENTLGGSLPEKFYDIGGVKAYVEIDGKAISDLYKSSNTRNSQGKLEGK